MKLKYQVCDFSKKNPAGKYFNKKSMERILNSADFKERLKSHDLMGTVSHKFRWDKQGEDTKNMLERKQVPILPQSDLMVEKGIAANCCIDVYLEGDSLIADLQVLESMDLGKKIKSMIEIDKVTPEVSMVVAEGEGPNDTIDILDFYGVDFTFLPALQSKLLSTYSKSNSYMNFMLDSDSSDIRPNAVSVNCYSKFLGFVDEVPELENDPELNDINCYSIREFIRVRDRKPMQALMFILNDIKNYINATKPEMLNKVKGLVMEYLTSYLFSKITQILNDPETKMVNLNLILGLNRFCSSQAMTEFQRVANLILRQKKSLGYIDKRSQELLAQATSKLIMSIFDWILKGVSDEKKEVFHPTVSKSDKNGEVKNEG